MVSNKYGSIRYILTQVQPPWINVQDIYHFLDSTLYYLFLYLLLEYIPIIFVHNFHIKILFISRRILLLFRTILAIIIDLIVVYIYTFYLIS